MIVIEQTKNTSHSLRCSFSTDYENRNDSTAYCMWCVRCTQPLLPVALIRLSTLGFDKTFDTNTNACTRNMRQSSESREYESALLAYRCACTIYSTAYVRVWRLVHESVYATNAYIVEQQNRYEKKKNKITILRSLARKVWNEGQEHSSVLALTKYNIRKNFVQPHSYRILKFKAVRLSVSCECECDKAIAMIRVRLQ